MTLCNKEAILPVSILVEGTLNLPVRLVSTHRRIVFPQEAQVYIDSVWQREALRRQGANLIDSQHVWMIVITKEGEYYDIVIGQTSFKERLATTSPDFMKRFGVDLVAKTVGVDMLMLTADQNLLVGQRRTYRPGKIGGLHIVGGLVEQNETLEATLVREIEEEVGLQDSEWDTVSLLGVTQSRETLAVDVIYFCATGLERMDIVGRNTDGELDIKFIPSTPDVVKKILLRFLRTASTPSVAALYLYGKQKFGLGWAEAILEGIERRTAVYTQFNPQQREIHMKKLAARLSSI